MWVFLWFFCSSSHFAFEHVKFKLSEIIMWPIGFWIMDWCSRPWLCYWILHSLAMLNQPFGIGMDKRTIDFLSRCQVCFFTIIPLLWFWVLGNNKIQICNWPVDRSSSPGSNFEGRDTYSNIYHNSSRNADSATLAKTKAASKLDSQDTEYWLSLWQNCTASIANPLTTVSPLST